MTRGNGLRISETETSVLLEELKLDEAENLFNILVHRDPAIVISWVNKR